MSTVPAGDSVASRTLFSERLPQNRRRSQCFQPGRGNKIHKLGCVAREQHFTPLIGLASVLTAARRDLAGVGLTKLDERGMREVAAQVIAAEGRAVAGVAAAIDESFLAVARLFLECRGKVVVVGSGTSGAVATRAAHLLSVGGTPAFSLSPADALHGGLGVLRSEDIVVALSKSGGSRELNDFCRLARPLCGGLVAITARRESELVSLVDRALFLTLGEDADLGGVIATGSSLATAALLDALVEVTRVARGYTWEQMLYTHPAGAVGHEAAQTLRRLTDEPEGA